MFNKNHIGRRVISKNFGIGTIIEFDTDRKISIGIALDMFINEDRNINTCDVYYYPNGTCCIETTNPDYNIKFYLPKKGSPDARKIVAMLALEYRNGIKWIPNEGMNKRIGRNTALKTVYNQAKQLLGEE